MKLRWLGVAAVLALTATGAQANADLAKKSACMACHDVGTKIVGPSFKDVAKKYAGQAGAEQKLFDKVKKGGSGAWGPVPMPPNVSVKDDDVTTLVKWILTLK